jgi:hypothetical protein
LGSIPAGPCPIGTAVGGAGGTLGRRATTGRIYTGGTAAEWRGAGRLHTITGNGTLCCWVPATPAGTWTAKRTLPGAALRSRSGTEAHRRLRRSAVRSTGDDTFVGWPPDSAHASRSTAIWRHEAYAILYLHPRPGTCGGVTKHGFTDLRRQRVTTEQRFINTTRPGVAGPGTIACEWIKGVTNSIVGTCGIVSVHRDEI